MEKKERVIYYCVRVVFFLSFELLVYVYGDFFLTLVDDYLFRDRVFYSVDDARNRLTEWS